jgi:Na+-translocating ferredoxin:NAD+ oxidoreductase RnfD subunit
MEREGSTMTSVALAAGSPPASHLLPLLVPPARDPRWLFAAFLASYVALGHWVLSFNRSLLEIGIALTACCTLDMLYAWVSSRRLVFPLSAMISGLGLAILFTSPGAGWLMLLASWLTISSKYLITWRGQHIFNPTNFALVVMILISDGRAAIAPAYQWGGSWQIICLVFALGLVMMSRVNKLPLVLAFWAVYAVTAVVRSYISGISIEILLWASVSGGAFMLYSFFMITDPKTSPSSTRGMIAGGIALGIVDGLFQARYAVFSLFYAAFTVNLLRAFFRIISEQAPSMLASAPRRARMGWVRRT